MRPTTATLNWIRVSLTLVGLIGATLAVRTSIRLAPVSQRHDELLTAIGQLPASHESAIHIVRLPSESLPGEHVWRWRVAIPPNCQPSTVLVHGAIAAHDPLHRGSRMSTTAFSSPDGREGIITMSLVRNTDGKWQVGVGGVAEMPLNLLDDASQELLDKTAMDDLIVDALPVGDSTTISLDEAKCLIRIRASHRAQLPDAEDDELYTGCFLYLMSAQLRAAFIQSSRRSP